MLSIKNARTSVKDLFVAKEQICEKLISNDLIGKRQFNQICTYANLLHVAQSKQHRYHKQLNERKTKPAVQANLLISHNTFSKNVD